MYVAVETLILKKVISKPIVIMRYFFSLLLALICWSCASDKQEMTEYVLGNSKTYSFSVDATLSDINIEENAEVSRASADNVIRLTWAADDAISVVNLTKGTVLGGQLKATSKGDRATFTGTLSGTIDDTDKLAFIYPSIGNSSVQSFTGYEFDYSQQDGSSKVPFCAYKVVSVSELNRSGTTFSASSLVLNFLMAYIRMGLCELPNSTQINKIEIYNLGSKLFLSINSNKDDFTKTSTTGKITLTPASLKSSDKGLQVVYMTCAESPAQSARRKINVYTDEKKYTSDMVSSAFAFLKNFNTIIADFSVTGNLSNGHEYVDLGLPSGTKWATMNIGAKSPEEWGINAMWGCDDQGIFENEYPYCHYQEAYKDPDTYDSDGFLIPGESHPAKYIYERLPQYIFDTDYDTAKKYWGEKWNIPTKDEADELYKYCTWTKAQLEGVNGWKVTGTNGNYIFLRDDWYYWTSTNVSERYSYVFKPSYLNNHSGYYIDSYEKYKNHMIRPVYIDYEKPSYITDKMEAVDLGLPSGTKWATKNLGAPNSYNIGEYYFWGETEPVDISNTSGKNPAKNNFGTNKDPLADYVNNGESIAGTQYDAAHVTLGGNWKMPTLEQIEELLQYCPRESVAFPKSRVKGYVFKGPNGNSIFFSVKDMSGFPDYRYLTSTPKDKDYIQSLRIYSSRWANYELSRDVWANIRPVCE